MGRPYAKELAELDQTYEWALTADVEPLAATISLLLQCPLIAIGSGGSLTSAHIACFLHMRFSGRVASVFTPYEIMGSPLSLDESALLFCSAGGSNPDILAAAVDAAKRQPRILAAITTRTNTSLGEQLHELSWPKLHAYDTPTRRDGFLATNSLLATAVLLTRGYHLACGVADKLPQSLAELLHQGRTRLTYVAALARDAAAGLSRRTLIVLHGGVTRAGATDVESRFTEAAIGHTQVADFRNFAHGRHHWLARHADSSAVFALLSSEDRNVAERTLSLIPNEVPRLVVEVADSTSGAIAAVCHSIFLAAAAGRMQGTDPGRPKVPMFGRRLYHLSAGPKSAAEPAVSDRARVAIERKAGRSWRTLDALGTFDQWLSHYCDFIRRLADADIRAIVFDYDGTLCAPSRRFQGVSKAIGAKLGELLRLGIVVGIATGRGGSVRDDLRRVVRSVGLRRRIVIAYHNGAEIGSLEDASVPPEESSLDPCLRPLANWLESASEIVGEAAISTSRSQVTVRLTARSDPQGLFESLARRVRELAPKDATVVSSTHSIDVIARGVSKLNILSALQDRFEVPSAETQILCIGDRGRWPGNDADLLTHPLSLSVDQVSRDPGTCWNLSAPGQRFDLACLDLLDMLDATKEGPRLDVRRLAP